MGYNHYHFSLIDGQRKAYPKYFITTLFKIVLSSFVAHHSQMYLNKSNLQQREPTKTLSGHPWDPKELKIKILHGQFLIDRKDVVFHSSAPLHCHSTLYSLDKNAHSVYKYNFSSTSNQADK